MNQIEKSLINKFQVKLKSEDNNVVIVEIFIKYDIVLFQNKSGVANHGGVILDYGKFIHCCTEGVLVDSYKRELWQKKLNGFYKFNE